MPTGTISVELEPPPLVGVTVACALEQIVVLTVAMVGLGLTVIVKVLVLPVQVKPLAVKEGVDDNVATITWLVGFSSVKGAAEPPEVGAKNGAVWVTLKGLLGFGVTFDGQPIL